MTVPILETRKLSASYGLIEVLHGVDISVGSGESVILLGPNGAGKSTLMRALMGLAQAQGWVSFNGADFSSLPTRERARAGMIMIPEGRGIFGSMTVQENLDLGGYSRRGADRGKVQPDLDQVFALFPRLRERREQLAGSLSGGEQQMLAIGRALMAKPRLLLLDEPSLGLAPMLAAEIFKALKELHLGGLSMLVVEQKAPLALEMAERVYVMRMGVIAAELNPSDIRSSEELNDLYMGTVGESQHA